MLKSNLAALILLAAWLGLGAAAIIPDYVGPSPVAALTRPASPDRVAPT